MQTKQTSITPIVCTVIGFLFILAVYSYMGGSFSARWQFAIVMSGAPAVLAWALTWWNRLRPYAWAVYIALFVLLFVVQMGLRTL